MDPKNKIENLDEIADETEHDEVSVDDFIKQLEAKEKDLHITADTTIIEIAEGFDDGELPEYLKKDLKLETLSPLVAAAAAAKKPAEPKPATARLENEIADLKEKIALMKADRDELFEASLRRAKDFENFRTRTERERKDTFQTQVGNLATQMLPALDNLNRAIDFALAMPAEQRDEIQQFVDGIVLVNQQVNEVLAEMGILPIATVGQEFDPYFHEAVATEESLDVEPNTISAELLRGYRIGDRVIRHSMVRVVQAPPSDELANHAVDDPEEDPQSRETDSHHTDEE